MPYGTPTDQSQHASYAVRLRYGQTEIFGYIQLEDGNTAASESAKDAAWQALVDAIAAAGGSGWTLVAAEKSYTTTETITPTEP